MDRAVAHAVWSTEKWNCVEPMLLNNDKSNGVGHTLGLQYLLSQSLDRVYSKTESLE